MRKVGFLRGKPRIQVLDSIRNETVWHRVQDTFKKKGLDMTVELVIEVAKATAKALLNS
jgi:hypothetical protein